MLIVEPYDEIQVFIRGTGCCLWGRIQPESSGGDYVLKLTVEPLPSTMHALWAAGIEDRLALGEKVTIPARLVEVVFGDDRHEAVA